MKHVHMFLHTGTVGPVVVGWAGVGIVGDIKTFHGVSIVREEMQ